MMFAETAKPAPRPTMTANQLMDRIKSDLARCKSFGRATRRSRGQASRHHADCRRIARLRRTFGVVASSRRDHGSASTTPMATR